MVRLIYRRANSINHTRRKGRLVSSFDELLDALLGELFNRPGFGPKSSVSFGHRGQPVPENLRSHGPWEEHHNKTEHQAKPLTQPCSNCGIRFSTNLMKDGVCHNCGSGDKDESEGKGPQDRRVNPSVSDKALRQAYQVLGCDEKDSDEMIKRRHRELAKEFHADRISPEASCDRINTANETFCKAQEAYEIIMVTRKRAS